ncbi:MAG: glycosyltransferase family 4 protein [Methylophagaceae bacterium]
MQKIYRYWIAFQLIRRKIGFLRAVKYALKKLFTPSLSRVIATSKPNVVDFYDFIYVNPFAELLEQEMRSNIINWVIPDFNIGSGGHLNIFRVVKGLEDKGFICRINIDGITHFSNGHEARKCIRKHFFQIEAEVSIGRQALLPAAATFATSWITAYTVRDFQASGKKYYFVQDFEPFFYALGSEYVFAEETYRFGFKAITAGNWLANKLVKKYGMEAIPFDFSYDRGLYKPHARREPNRKRVFYYARPVTSRRAFELGILTLAKVHEKNPEIEFILAGWDVSSYEIPFPHLNAGVCSLEALPDLYSQCDVALIISLTNLSLLPLEIMACGCAVVSNTGNNVEWMLNESNTKLVEPSPAALSGAIVHLIENPQVLSSLKSEGLKFAETTNWSGEIDKIIGVLEQDLS